MSNKIDDLFSPERLRRSWQKTKEQAGEPVSDDTEGKTPLDILERLRSLIQAKFSGDDVFALNCLLDDLHAILTRMFPNSGDDKDQAGFQADMIPAIDDILNRIEDLVEAFDIAGRSRLRA